MLKYWTKYTQIAKKVGSLADNSNRYISMILNHTYPKISDSYVTE